MVVFIKTYGLRLLLGLIGIYALFFLSLGTRTFAQHMLRIGRTPEARELYSELGGTIGSATSAVTRRIRAATGGNSSSSY
jgi:hypothetical protein